jgi:hypothetical protein
MCAIDLITQHLITSWFISDQAFGWLQSGEEFINLLHYPVAVKVIKWTIRWQERRSAEKMTNLRKTVSGKSQDRRYFGNPQL